MNIDLNSKLNTACFDGNQKNVIELIEQGADINCVNEYNYSPLIAAISGEQISIVKLLIEKGCNINCDKSFPLHELFITMIDDLIQNFREKPKNVYIDILTLLLKTGADLNLRDLQGRTALDIIKVFNPDLQAFNNMKNNLRTLIPDIDKRVQLKM